MVTILYMLGISVITAVAGHVSLHSREQLGLSGKQDKNICSIRESALAAQRTSRRPMDAPNIPNKDAPSVTDTPLRECDLLGSLCGSLEEAAFEQVLSHEGQWQRWQLFSGESIGPSRQRRVCQRQRRLPAGVCQHVRELPVQMQEWVPAAREWTRLQRG